MAMDIEDPRLGMAWRRDERTGRVTHMVPRMGSQAGNPWPVGRGAVLQVSASRTLTADDDGAVLECTAGGITLTVPAVLPPGFACRVIPGGTTSIASSGGTLLNGATTTLTRAAGTNPLVEIQARASSANSYVVTGS